MTDTQRRISDRAYAIWEAEGRPEGRHEQHWLAAEAESRATAPKRARRRPPASETDGLTAPRPTRRTARKTKAD